MAEWDTALNGRPHCTVWLKTFTKRSGINKKLLKPDSIQDTMNDVRATLSKSEERINVLEGSQDTRSRNIETLKTDLHDAVKKSNKDAFWGLVHTSHHRKKQLPLPRPILH